MAEAKLSPLVAPRAGRAAHESRGNRGASWGQRNRCRRGDLCVLTKERFGASHSLVVHELWVLVVVGSNPSAPTSNFAESFDPDSDWANGWANERRRRASGKGRERLAIATVPVLYFLGVAKRVFNIVRRDVADWELAKRHQRPASVSAPPISFSRYALKRSYHSSLLSPSHTLLCRRRLPASRPAP